MQNNYLYLSAVVFAALYFIYPQQAHAYLDPGSGSLIFQLVIGAVLGTLVTMRMYWSRVKRFVRGIFGGKSAPTDAPSDDPAAAEESPGQKND